MQRTEKPVRENCRRRAGGGGAVLHATSSRSASSVPTSPAELAPGSCAPSGGVTSSFFFSSFPSAILFTRPALVLVAPQICVFGTATAIFCQGILRDHPGSLNTFSPDLGLYWLMPLIALPFTGAGGGGSEEEAGGRRSAGRSAGLRLGF